MGCFTSIKTRSRSWKDNKKTYPLYTKAQVIQPIKVYHMEITFFKKKILKKIQTKQLISSLFST